VHCQESDNGSLLSPRVVLDLMVLSIVPTDTFSSFGLSILGSWSKRRKIHRWTYISNNKQAIKEVDHIVFRHQNSPMIKSCRVYRGAEAPTSSDQRLLLDGMRLRMPFPANRHQSRHASMWRIIVMMSILVHCTQLRKLIAFNS